MERVGTDEPVTPLGFSPSDLTEALDGLQLEVDVWGRGSAVRSDVMLTLGATRVGGATWNVYPSETAGGCPAGDTIAVPLTAVVEVEGLLTAEVEGTLEGGDTNPGSFWFSGRGPLVQASDLIGELAAETDCGPNVDPDRITFIAAGGPDLPVGRFQGGVAVATASGECSAEVVSVQVVSSE